MINQILAMCTIAFSIVGLIYFILWDITSNKM